jgi:hypothetical protein
LCCGRENGIGDEYPLRLGVKAIQVPEIADHQCNCGQRVTASSSAIAASLDLARYSSRVAMGPRAPRAALRCASIVTMLESVSFLVCEPLQVAVLPARGIDCRDLGQVFEHEGPLPYLAQDQPQRRSVRDSNRRHAAHLPRPKGLRDGGRAVPQSKQPHSMVEVKDLKSGDVTAVALRPA